MRSSDFSINKVLALFAAVLGAGLGVWLFLQPDGRFRAAGAVALLGAALAAAAGLLRRSVANREPLPATPAPTVTPPPPALSPEPVLAIPAIDPRAVADGGALRLLAKLQEQGRLIDFALEDIRSVSDAQVAAVARVVHAGCRSTLESAFELQPLHAAAEGASVTLAPGFDPEAHRLLGKVAGTPPFNGTLLHRGWHTATVKLPHATDPARPHSGIVAPAEIELR